MAGSVAELLGGAEQREAFLHGDSKSGSAFERVVVHGEPRIVKYVHPDDDWTMRFFGEGCRPLEVWRSGLMDACPERIDHTVVAAAGGLGRDGLGAALVMRDVGPHLVPEGDAPLSVDLNRSLVTDMAALGASTWGWRDDLGLVSAERRWGAFTDAQLADEAARGWPNPVPRIAHDGWARFEAEAPAAARDLMEKTAIRDRARTEVDAARTALARAEARCATAETAQDEAADRAGRADAALAAHDAEAEAAERAAAAVHDDDDAAG